MTAESKIKSIAAGVTVTLFATLVGTGVLYRDNSLLSENIQAEKVRTERLEAERSALKSEMDKLSKDLSTYKVKNGELDLIFREAQQKLELQQARVAQLTKFCASFCLRGLNHVSGYACSPATPKKNCGLKKANKNAENE